MKPYVIPKNKTGIFYQIGATGLLVLIACIVLGMFYGRISGVAPVTHQILSLGTWIVLPFVWATLSLRVWLSSTSSTYTLFNDSLRIRTTSWLGESHESLYRYDSILSISSYSRENGKYGAITLRLDRQDDLALLHISQPAEQAALIKKLVNANRRHTNFI